MKPIIFFVLVISLYNDSFAQDISGKWVSVSARDSVIVAGLSRMDNWVKKTIKAPDSVVMANLKRKYTLFINKKNTSLSGTSNFKSREMGLEIRSELIGTVDAIAHTMTISDEDMYVTNSDGYHPSKRIYNPDYTEVQGYYRDRNNTHTYNWQYTFDDAHEYLKLEIAQRFGNSLFAKWIVFQRPKKSAKNTDHEKGFSIKHDSTFIHPVTVRKDMVFQEIVTDTDSIKIDLYDVGDIDGDSVSLFLNGKLIASHQLLKASAITFNIVLDRTLPENKFVLFAENLGSIPPNTAFMVITVGKKEYRLNMQSDEKTNGQIVFRF
jgi:hypothetical protein